MQLELPIKPQMTAVDAALVDKRSTFTSALVLCAELGDMTPQRLAGPIVKDEESWSRIKSPTPKQFFPQDRLLDFMNLCQNEVPLIWLARRRGYNLVPMETELQRQLRLRDEAIAAKDAEILALRRALRS